MDYSTLRAGSMALQSYVAAHWRWRSLNERRLAEFQDSRARATVRFANEHSPFYRQHWHGCDLDNWRTLPTVDKAAMMGCFDEFNTRGVRREAALAVAQQAEQTRNFAPVLDGLTVGLSSGTSGRRGLFLVSPQEQALWASVILARALHGLRLRRTRVAFFLRSNSNLYAQTNGALIALRYFDLATPLEAVAPALNDYRPHIVVGPGSLLDALAEQSAAGVMRIRPERLIAVAEVLEPHDEARLRSAFGCPVHQVYQCTEGLLAVSCAHGSLHLQEDIVAVQCEPLPPDGSGVERVTPIVTDLWRRVQPIVRYRLGDVLQLRSASCPCGSPFRVIDRIEGRLDDVLWFAAAEGEPNRAQPCYPGTLGRLVLGAEAGIADYLVVQEYTDELTVYLRMAAGRSFPDAAAAVAAAIAQAAPRYGWRQPHLSVLEGIPARPAWVKRRRVQRIQGSAGQ